MRGKRRATALVAVFVALAVGAGVAYHESGGASTANSAQVMPSAAVIAHFSVLGGPQGADDALPATAGINAAIQRKLETSDPAIEQWASLNGEELCVAVAGPAVGSQGLPSACNTSSAVAEGRELLAVEAGGARGTSNVIAGLAPDGVPSVTVTFTDGTTATAKVGTNGFHLHTNGKRLKMLTWTTPAGTYHEEG